MTTAAQFRLLSTLRNVQYTHLATSLSPDLFTDERHSLFAAYQIAMRTYGNLSAEAIENAYREPLPPELDVPVMVDPLPLIDDLARAARKRISKELGQELLRQSDAYEPDVKGIRERLEQLDNHVMSDPSIIPGVSQFLANMRNKQRDDYRWLSSGVNALDLLLGGEYPRGELTIITGKSGGGKSSLMGSSALNIAEQHMDHGTGTRPTIFSLEMPKAQLINRWVADLTGIDSRVLRYGRNMDGTPFTAMQVELIDKAVQRLLKLPISIIDTERMSADQIVAAARVQLAEMSSEIFYVDYLQLMSYDVGDGKHYGLGDAAKILLRFAKRHNVAVVVLAQFHETKGTIRDSTDPEKDCAVWVHIDIDYDAKDEHGMCSATIALKKNRHGPVGKVTLLYDSRRLRFVSNESV